MVRSMKESGKTIINTAKAPLLMQTAPNTPANGSMTLKMKKNEY